LAKQASRRNPEQEDGEKYRQPAMPFTHIHLVKCNCLALTTKRQCARC
jgi:hypothetical protein